MWPAIVVALENTIVARHHKAETKAKISKATERLQNFKQYLCLLGCSWENVASGINFWRGKSVTIWSEAFEQTKPFRARRLSWMHWWTRQNVDSHYNRFLFNEDNDGNQTLLASFVKFGLIPRDLENREIIMMQFKNFDNLNESSLNKARKWKKKILPTD